MHPSTTAAPSSLEPIKRRVAVLFCGFEPLDADAQHMRFQRTAAQTGQLWNFSVECGPLHKAGPAKPHFDIRAAGPDWQTDTRFFVAEHSDLIATMTADSLPVQIARGYRAFGSIVLQGGAFSYFRYAWRFALFFLFPFLFMALGLSAAATLALAPWLGDLSLLHLIWSAPLGFAFFRYVFLPVANRLHTLLLFANWRLARDLTRLDNAKANAKLDKFVDTLRTAFAEPSDEYLIASHSMGSNFATHALGMLIEQDPEIIKGKRIVFATLGGALLQCALPRKASVLRSRAGLILRSPEITWYEIQSLTDPIHFYKAPVARATGHADAPKPPMLFLRVKHVLTPERYRRVRRDLLRVHRQYVLPSDVRAPYDFGLMVGGPLPAASFTRYSHTVLPPLDADGAIGPNYMAGSPRQ